MSTYQLKKSQADLTDFFAAVFSQQYKDVFGRQNSQEKAGAFVLSIEEGQILAALSYQLLYQTIKISDLAVQMQALVAANLIEAAGHAGYTYVEQRVDPMLYTDWGLLTEQEIQLYKPQ